MNGVKVQLVRFESYVSPHRSLQIVNVHVTCIEAQLDGSCKIHVVGGSWFHVKESASVVTARLYDL